MDTGPEVIEKHQLLSGRLARFQLDLLGCGVHDVRVANRHLFYQIGARFQVIEVDLSALRRGFGIKQFSVLVDFKGRSG